jgi:site-specific DNA-methyltransferase (adenine-specific)
VTGRVETIGDCTLYLGDCLEILPTLGKVDAVVTDPPYSQHVHSSSMRGAAGWKGKIAVERKLGFDALTDVQRQAIAQFGAESAARWVLVFSDTESSHLWRDEMESQGLEYVRTAFWRKLNGAPQFTGDRPAVACEAITICHPRGRKRWNGGGRQGFYDVPIAMDRGGSAGEERVHTTQKPIALMNALVGDFTDNGEVICDPFMGSGTTGVACVNLGRKFIGIEIEPRYFDIACRRIEEAYKQPRLFAEPKPEPKQEALL